MEALYKIEEELLSIFGEIEEAEGEVTDELYEKLCIKQNELKSKLESYYKAVKIWADEADSCKKEKARINTVQNKYKNRVERLRKYMLDAVLQFGDKGKTNKFIELPTVRLSSRSTTDAIINEDRIKLLIDNFCEYVAELESAGALVTGDDIDLNSFIDALNQSILTEKGSDFVPYSVYDLYAIKVNISETIPLAKILTTHDYIVKPLTYSANIKVEDATTSKDCLEILKVSDKVTIAEKTTKNSLLIK